MATRTLLAKLEVQWPTRLSRKCATRFATTSHCSNLSFRCGSSSSSFFDWRPASTPSSGASTIPPSATQQTVDLSYFNLTAAAGALGLFLSCQDHNGFTRQSLVDGCDASGLRTAAMCEGAAVTNNTRKNELQQEPKDESGGANDEDKSEEDDPYANLPDEDAPTDCSMCNTFRQGPCRPHWRKLERCFKDNESAEEGGSNCIRYFLPHQECLTNYMNLYLLIGHEMKQEIVADAEKAFLPDRKGDRRPLAMPEIDWSLYHEFVKDQGTSFSQTLPNLPPDTPLWKRLPDETEPVLITVKTSVDSIDEPTGWILKVAYVLDQDGKVLGFVYNETYGNLLKESKGETVSEEDRAKESPSVSVDFVLMPGETKSIRLFAFYSENPAKADPEKEILDGCLCETPAVPLPQAPPQ